MDVQVVWAAIDQPRWGPSTLAVLAEFPAVANHKSNVGLYQSQH